MRFEVLGPLRVVGTDGGLVRLPSVTQRRLLSLLLSRAGTNVSSDYLGDCLDLSAGGLRVAISRLRRIVGFGALVTAPPGYELRTDRIDALLFEQLVERAAREPDAAIITLRTALALWRGDAYAEFADEEWAVVAVHRLAELRVAAIEDLVELLLAGASGPPPSRRSSRSSGSSPSVTVRTGLLMRVARRLRSAHRCTARVPGLPHAARRRGRRGAVRGDHTTRTRYRACTSAENGGASRVRVP